MKDYIPLGLSVLSLIVAFTSLGWNIYRDLMLKARLRVHFGIRLLITPGLDERPEYVMLMATNHGPGALNVSTVVLLQSSWWRVLIRKKRHAFLMTDYMNPLSGRLPKTLGVGERIDLLFPYDKQSFLSEQWTHIGLTDSFGRTHWAPSSSVAEAREAYSAKFAAA